MILHGPCEEQLLTLADASVDSIVTDPPYGIHLMGRRWDAVLPSAEAWAHCLRVLKPGGHLLAFSGTRTQHRMACAIEDAGFEIRDMIGWMYGSGKPASKALEGGWGTRLKPAFEPITMARKPLDGTVVANMDRYGVGGLNIDACRVHAPDAPEGWQHLPRLASGTEVAETGKWTVPGAHTVWRPAGRWPANLIHDGSDAVVNLFPAEAGANSRVTGEEASTPARHTYGAMRRVPGAFHNDSGSAARFFYCAKPSRAERHKGLVNPGPQFQHGTTKRHVETAQEQLQGNTHETVKPVALMRYLCRLVTPPTGVVLDPYCGSGSTGVAAIEEGFQFIGIEREARYVEIARLRLAVAQPGLGLLGMDETA